MSEKTEEELNEILDDIKFQNSIEDIEYIDNLRKEDPIVDSYISLLELELKDALKLKIDLKELIKC